MIIASLSQSREDLINEFGDLFYHLVVLMVQKGVSLEEISAELNAAPARNTI